MRATLVLVALYLGVVLVSAARHSGELFPFFDWELFSRVPPAESDDWTVRLTEAGGAALAEPVYFAEAGRYLSNTASPDAQNLLQSWGRAVDGGDASAAGDARSIFETRFLRELESGRYELVRRRYDVLERVTCRCFLSEVVIAEYDVR